MHLSGQLSDWSINDLLQIMQVTKKTGSLDIEGSRRGRIHFIEGTVTGAELSAATGRYVGEDRGGVADVLYVLSTLDQGSFAVGPADGPASAGWDVEEILADVAALKELEDEVADAGIFEADGVGLTTDITEPLTISPEDWVAVAALVQPFTVDELETELGRGGAVRLLHTLHRLGIAEPLRGEVANEKREEEDESGWLDRLAEDMVPESSEPTWSEEVEVEVPPGPEPVSAEELAAEQSEDDRPGEIAPVRIPPADVRGVSAPASTTLTDGVYDEIRRLRSKVADR